MKVDIKTVITLGTLLFAFAGFYYTTEARLKAVELEILDVQQQLFGRPK